MFSHSRVLAFPKDPEYPHVYEDAAFHDPQTGRAAVADGVGSAIFSDRWANVLVRSVVKAPPPDLGGAGFLAWLKDSRTDWRGQIDFKSLSPNQRQKLADCGGAFSTLLWLSLVDAEGVLPGDRAESNNGECEVDPAQIHETSDREAATEEAAPEKPGGERPVADEPTAEGPVAEEPVAEVPLTEDPKIEGTARAETGFPAELRLRIHAMGDCNLFLVRDGNLVETFPMKHSSEFAGAPESLCSIPSKRDERFVIRTHECVCREGDWLVLCTDAIAQHLLRRMEENDVPDWYGYWTVDDAVFLEELGALRSDRRIRRDDTTLLLLCVGPVPPPEPEATEAGAAAFVAGEPEIGEGGGAVNPDEEPGCDGRPTADEAVSEVAGKDESGDPLEGEAPVEPACGAAHACGVETEENASTPGGE